MEVSGHAPERTAEQMRLAQLYGTCAACGAPRTVVSEELAPDIRKLSFACLNGHWGDAVSA